MLESRRGFLGPELRHPPAPALRRIRSPLTRCSWDSGSGRWAWRRWKRGKEEVGKEERVNRGEPAGAGRGGRVGTGRARAQELSGRLQTAARAAAPESRELADWATFPAGAASSEPAHCKVMCQETASFFAR